MGSFASSTSTLDQRCNTVDTELAEFDAAYQRKIGWFVFSGIVLFILLINIPFIVLIGNIDSESSRIILYDLQLQGAYLETRATEIGTKLAINPTVVTQAEIIELTVTIPNKGAALLQTIDKLKADNKKAWTYCLISGLIHLILCLIIIALVIWKRKLQLVRSRGTSFLIQLFVSVPISIILAMLLSAFETQQIKTVDPFDGTDAYLNSYMTVGIFTIFLTINLVGSMVSRARLVYLAYSINSTKTISKRTYWEIFPVHLFFATLISIPFCIYGFGGYVGNSSADAWRSIAIFPILLIYIIWISFYVWSCRNAAAEYSDLYINLRCLIFIFFTMLGGTLTDIFANNLNSGTIFQFIYQSYALLYLLDQFSSLAFKQQHLKKEEEEKTRRADNMTGATNQSYCESNISKTKMDMDRYCSNQEESLEISSSHGDLRQLSTVSMIEAHGNNNGTCYVYDGEPEGEDVPENV